MFGEDNYPGQCGALNPAIEEQQKPLGFHVMAFTESDRKIISDGDNIGVLQQKWCWQLQQV